MEIEDHAGTGFYWVIAMDHGNIFMLRFNFDELFKNCTQNVFHM